MTQDYWSWLATVDIPSLGVESSFERATQHKGDFGERTIADKTKIDAESLAFYRQFERLACLYRQYEASNVEAGDGRGSIAVKERVKQVYSTLLRSGYKLPQAVTDIMATLTLLSPTVDLMCLPRYSVQWSIPFKLETEYISRDDPGLYAIDNPVRKDSIFKLPLVASTSWKGALRAAYRHVHGVDDDAEDVVRLFGIARDDETGQAGHLHFYSTFFDRMGIKVINPHDRKTGIGASGPILFETVPPGSDGLFTLLYVPGMDEGIEQIARDVQQVSTAIAAMFITYGFGAKTSSGSGTARPAFSKEAQLAIKAQLTIDASPIAAVASQSPAPGLARYLERPDRLHADFRSPDGGIVSEKEYETLLKSRGQSYSKTDRLLYEKAKKWWERQQSSPVSEQAESPAPSPELPAVTTLPVASFDDLLTKAQKLGDALAKEVAA